MLNHLALLQIFLYLFIITILVKPLGLYMMQVYETKVYGLHHLMVPIENFIYKICKIEPERAMNWQQYLVSVLIFNFIAIFIVFFIQKLQIYLPFNPQHLPNLSTDLALNTAIAFNTNTDWQAYSGEITMSYFTQMFALGSQNFTSAATGIAILLAFIRGIVGREGVQLGNFWVDLTRGILYILLPLSCIFALILVSQGVIQNFSPNKVADLIQTIKYQENSDQGTQVIKTQIIPMGPVASQIAIKQLGTNGGGFFNVNSAHPFENPNPLTNFLELLAILLIPAALCYTFGLMVGDRRQGWAIFAAMMIIFIPFLIAGVVFEQSCDPALLKLGINTQTTLDSSGGNMEGKETRFGITSSAIWAAATTASSRTRWSGSTRRARRARPA